MPIQVLPPEIASQIAAGEVVERPASVIKELIENALDAGATFISIKVDEAGKRLMEVADNGKGIAVEELPLSIARHATSKLSTAEDLFSISTLGFRGEALAAIGSVARMTITSRVSGVESGARMRVEGGKHHQPEPVGAPVGTVVRVENLFYNVPARLKFLKSDRTERRQIDDVATRYALAFPGVRFQLDQDGRSVFHTSGKGDRRETLGTLYGVEIARQMLEVMAEEDALSIEGFISPISLTRSNRREIIFYINGRPIYDIALSTALLQAYRTLIMVGRYPVAYLFLRISPELVDVNVHPTKAEVRLRNPNQVFSGVQRATKRALLAHTPVPTANGSADWLHGGWESYTEKGGQHSAIPEARSSDTLTGNHEKTMEFAKQIPSGKQGQVESMRTPILRLIGQIASTYLVAEGPDGLYLVDQHAAHERVLFEKLMGQRFAEIEDGDQVASQALLEPIPVELSPASARLIEEQLPVLNEFGFRIDPFGPRTFLVRGLPTLLSGMDPAAALRVLVEDFEEDEAPLQSETEARIVARVCKRAAVKAGQVLSPEEQRALLIDLEKCQSPRTCPHGRPTMIHLSVDLLERQFGRRGAR